MRLLAAFLHSTTARALAASGSIQFVARFLHHPALTLTAFTQSAGHLPCAFLFLVRKRSPLSRTHAKARSLLSFSLIRVSSGSRRGREKLRHRERRVAGALVRPVRACTTPSLAKSRCGSVSVGVRMAYFLLGFLTLGNAK